MTKKQPGIVLTVSAGSAGIGGHYLTKKGRRVIVRDKTADEVVLWSESTKNLVPVSLDYPLVPVWETLF